MPSGAGSRHEAGGPLFNRQKWPSFRPALTADRATVQAIPANQYASIEASALYLVAGFDANAAVAARQISGASITQRDHPEAHVAGRMAECARALFELRVPAPADSAAPSLDLPAGVRVRWEAWRRIADGVERHVAWLLGGADPQDAASELASLSARLDRAGVDADVSHIANLLAAACSATEDRALRTLVQDPEGTLAAYVDLRARSRPLLWPAAATYSRSVVASDSAHAVVAVPTGAGKSSVAELGIAASLDLGWILYLTPTNALAAQVTRDLSRLFGGLENVSVSGFLGGAEFTSLAEDSVDDVGVRQVLVMTPEKCSLALRQSPEAFGRLSLLVMDECHLLGAKGARGVTAELTVSAVLERAPTARVIMLSALLENADEIGAWLETATGGSTEVITTPWRPTRTLRGVLGIDPDRSEPEFQEARQFLDERPKRKTRDFAASVNLLTSCQGAWKTLDSDDYALIRSSLAVKLTAERRGSEIVPSRTGYVNAATASLTKQLADSGERVLAFLPANRHHSFSVARDLPDLSPDPKPGARLDGIRALLDLADFELGIESPLRSLIDRGIAVHTSAMLRDEQRASELSFVDGQARAIFATSTLAQGLNLPATAVVIGGTRIGDQRGVPTATEEERTRAELLNAIGRAGRAYVSARSIGIVIPDRWIPIRAGDSPEAARRGAPFLQYQDASTEVASQIQALIRTALDNPDVQVGRLTDEELAAFTFLASDDPAEGRAILQKSYGAFREGLDSDQALGVSRAINRAGAVFVQEVEAPEWVVEASRVSGVSLPAMGGLLRSALAVEDGPGETVGEWREFLSQVLNSTPPRLIAPLLPAQPFEHSPMEALVNPEARQDGGWAEAIDVLDRSLGLWMSGASLDAMVEVSLGKESGNPGRGSGNPIPKILALTESGFGFGVSRLAGALTALFAVGENAGATELPALAPGQRFALDLFPLGVRFGCDSSASLAWYRWGFRRRRLAHLLADALPPPIDLGPDDWRGWIGAARGAALGGEFDDGLSEEVRGLLDSLRLAERV
jgi:hypothetical protein